MKENPFSNQAAFLRQETQLQNEYPGQMALFIDGKLIIVLPDFTDIKIYLEARPDLTNKDKFFVCINE